MAITKSAPIGFRELQAFSNSEHTILPWGVVAGWSRSSRPWRAPRPRQPGLLARALPKPRSAPPSLVAKATGRRCLSGSESALEGREKESVASLPPEDSFCSVEHSNERATAAAVILSTTSDEASGCELKSMIKSLGNKSEAKFPAIDKTSVKQKQKPSTSSKKTEKSGPSPKKDTSASQKPILSRRQRMNQRSLLENPDSEHARRVEGKGRKTPLLQGIAKITKGSVRKICTHSCPFN